jgi:hypothetical protein
MWFLFLLLLFSAGAEAARCRADSQAGEECHAKISRLRPTQFGLGLVDVEAKRQELKGSEKKGWRFLKENPAQVVVGPEGELYLIDRHHLTRAAWEKGFRHTRAEIVDNLSHLSKKEFWETMKARGWVHLRSEKGRPRTVAQLPRHVRELQDDPYRSLAWVVRQAGGFEKTQVPFSEFDWAEHYRSRITIKPGKNGWKAAVKEAIAIAATSPELPGALEISAAARPRLEKECWKSFKRLELPLP